MKKSHNYKLIEEQTGILFNTGVSLAKHLKLKQATSIFAAIKRHGFYLDRKTRYTYVYAEDFTGLKKPFEGKRNRRWNDIDDNFGNHYTSLCSIASLYANTKKERGVLTIKIMKAFEEKGKFVGPDGKIFTPNSCTVPNTERENAMNIPVVNQVTELKNKTKVCEKLANKETVQIAKENVKAHMIKQNVAKSKINQEVKFILQKLLQEDKIETMRDILETMLEKENY